MAKKCYTVDLIKQMAECDANYIRLLKLVPPLNVYLDRSFEALDLAEFDLELPAELPTEPEKTLEGISLEFSIADLEGSHEKVVVKIKIVEAFKYTTTLEITQRPELQKWMTNPSMLVRVYHDANTAEVISYQGHKNLLPRYNKSNSKMYYPDEKMQVNQFLGEWLTHCINVGRCTKVPDLLF
jgi:hypothetical protein